MSYLGLSILWSLPCTLTVNVCVNHHLLQKESSQMSVERYTNDKSLGIGVLLVQLVEYE